MTTTDEFALFIIRDAGRGPELAEKTDDLGLTATYPSREAAAEAAERFSPLDAVRVSRVVVGNAGELVARLD